MYCCEVFVRSICQAPEGLDGRSSLNDRNQYRGMSAMTQDWSKSSVELLDWLTVLRLLQTGMAECQDVWENGLEALEKLSRGGARNLVWGWYRGCKILHQLRWFMALLTRFQPSKVVQDFFHPQYGMIWDDVGWWKLLQSHQECRCPWRIVFQGRVSLDISTDVSGASTWSSHPTHRTFLHELWMIRRLWNWLR